MKKERVILAGSEGVIGSALAGYLKGHYDIICLSRRFGHDFTDEKFVKRWFKDHPAEYLVNTFGLNDHVTAGKRNATLFDVDLDSIDEFLNVNVTSLFSVCREFARNKKAKGIINFSSVYGMVSPVPAMYKGGEKHIGYSISKGAVIQLTRHLAVHLAPRIRVNCIVPGGVLHKQGKAFIKRYGERLPMGRMMRKDELNGMVRHLCSDESTYMTGATVVIDGGWTII